MTKFKNHSYFSGLTKNTFLLALTSLFSDIATEMLYPVLPIFLTQNLKAGGSIVGIVEGIALATQNIIQGFSGWLSDKLQKRKPVAVFGYILAAVAKPLIGFSSSWPQVLGARFLDRLGAGTRSAPRDALIAASSDEDHRGKAFGLEGIGDNLGAFLGPLIAVFLLFALRVDIRSIFYWSLIPSLLSIFMIFLVKEKPIIVQAKGSFVNNLSDYLSSLPLVPHLSIKNCSSYKQMRPKSKLDLTLNKFPKEYWKYLAVIAIFGLGNSSSAFLILQTRNSGVPLEGTILIYAVYNLVAALISYPSGSLSDKFGRKNILFFAFLVFLITYLGFALTKNVFIIGGLFILYGCYQGIFRAVGKALASDFVPQNLRASSIGWYSTTVGLSSLFASIAAGQLWDRVNHPAVFMFGAIFAILGTIALFFLVSSQK